MCPIYPRARAHSPSRRGLAIALCGFLAVLASAQVIIPPPVPQWIRATDTTLKHVEFLHVFEGPTQLVQAVLLGASESSMNVHINGAHAGVLGGSTQSASLDLTRHLRIGPNQLVIEAQHDHRPPTIAALLELNSGLSRQDWVATGPDWNVRSHQQKLSTSNPTRVNPWSPAVALGPTSATPGGNPFSDPSSVDSYNSWKLASNAGQATLPGSLKLPPGFRAELVRSARPEEGSWVAMSFDPEGRLVLAREKRGLIRLTFRSPGLTVSPVELIEDTLLECRGLLHAEHSLFANANNSKTLVRLDDLNRDGKYDSIHELLRTEGGVGHGRNHLRWGPDAHLYAVHGNNVRLPSRLSADSPLKAYAEDQWVPCAWDPGMFDGDVLAPAGHVLRIDPNRPVPSLYAGGFRNAMDVAFNEEGEMFTFDADMEWDIGAPWYMPNRVLHVVSGADYGFRRGTGRFPEYYPDTLPSAVQVGLASPTAILFGKNASFPARYQRALYVCDWSYGRVLAVHLDPHGASYRGRTETFLAGRPFNVTDACIGPDGAMWLITGGRGTQSGLYRVTWEGTMGTESAPQEKTRLETLESARLRKTRRQLESWHGEFDGSELRSRIQQIGENLGHQDRWIRHAARVALERIPSRHWREQALLELDIRRLLPYLLALARVGDPRDLEPLLHRLLMLAVLHWDGLSEENQLWVFRTMGVALSRHPGNTNTSSSIPIKSSWAARFDRLERAAGPHAERELGRMLAYFDSPRLLPFAISKLSSAETSEDLLYYLFLLRGVDRGWSLEMRQKAFETLRRAEQLPGGKTYYKALSDIRREMVKSLTPVEREALGTMIEHDSKPVATPASGAFVRDWKAEELEPWLHRVSASRPVANGRDAFNAAQCAQCHRVGAEGTAPATFGPDLAGIASRFGRKDLLEHILEPSKVVDEKYRQVRLEIEGGREATGLIEEETGTELAIRENPLTRESTVITKTAILSRRTSDISPMPSGLLNHLTADQILDLLAYLEFHAK